MTTEDILHAKKAHQSAKSCFCLNLVFRTGCPDGLV